MPSIINATTTNGVAISPDNSGSLQLATNNGTTAVTIDTSQNVGIGTGSPSTKLDINNGALQVKSANNTGTDSIIKAISNNGTASTWLTFNGVSVSSGNTFVFYNGTTEQARITSGGDLFLNTTATFSYANGKMCINADGSGNPGLVVGVNSTSSAYNNIVLGNSTGGVGRIQTNGSATSYLTSSDYRLKTDVTPIQNAIATIQRLNPVAFTWTVDNREDAGFLAHEFQEVLPNYADGTKDEVDAEGNPVYQAVDKSGAIPYLVKAIQELKAELDATKAEVQALKGVA